VVGLRALCCCNDCWIVVMLTSVLLSWKPIIDLCETDDCLLHPDLGCILAPGATGKDWT
jgi:hypothetical protein